MAGLGIVRLPVFSVGCDIAEGWLWTVMPDGCVPGHEVYAAYPSNRHLAPRLGYFVDFLTERFVGEPWERGVPA